MNDGSSHYGRVDTPWGVWFGYDRYAQGTRKQRHNTRQRRMQAFRRWWRDNGHKWSPVKVDALTVWVSSE